MFRGIWPTNHRKHAGPTFFFDYTRTRRLFLFGLFGKKVDDEVWKIEVRPLFESAKSLLTQMSECASAVNQDKIRGWSLHSDAMSRMGTFDSDFKALGKSLKQIGTPTPIPTPGG